MSIVNIIKGNINRALKLNKELAEERLERACKLCFASHRDGKYTGWCRMRNQGCGCSTEAKVTIPDEVCPFNIWGEGFIDEDQLQEMNESYGFRLYE